LYPEAKRAIMKRKGEEDVLLYLRSSHGERLALYRDCKKSVPSAFPAQPKKKERRKVHKKPSDRFLGGSLVHLGQIFGGALGVSDQVLEKSGKGSLDLRSADVFTVLSRLGSGGLRLSSQGVPGALSEGNHAEAFALRYKERAIFSSFSTYCP